MTRNRLNLVEETCGELGIEQYQNLLTVPSGGFSAVINSGNGSPEASGLITPLSSSDWAFFMLTNPPITPLPAGWALFISNSYMTKQLSSPLPFSIAGLSGTGTGVPGDPWMNLLAVFKTSGPVSVVQSLGLNQNLPTAFPSNITPGNTVLCLWDVGAAINPGPGPIVLGFSDSRNDNYQSKYASSVIVPSYTWLSMCAIFAAFNVAGGPLTVTLHQSGVTGAIPGALLLEVAGLRG